MTIFNILGTFGARGYRTMTQMGEVEVQLGRTVDPTDVANPVNPAVMKVQKREGCEFCQQSST